MNGRTLNESKGGVELEVEEFFPYYGYIGVKLTLNLSESNANNDGASKVQPVLKFYNIFQCTSTIHWIAVVVV